MKFVYKCLIVLLMIMICLSASAEDIYLEFLMPGNMFMPGSAFSLSLAVENSSSAFSEAQLFVALTLDANNYWFYPSWVSYPPDIDWDTIFVPPYVSDQWVILPEFSWPYGAGAFDGAMFLSAILHNGKLVSNLAQTQFGWSEAPQPTPTPTTPAATATPSPTPTLTPTVTAIPTTPGPTATPTPSPTVTPIPTTPGPTFTPTITPTPAPIWFVHILPGSYTRGSPSDEPCRHSTRESPQHQVTLTRGFYMMKTEVTRQMWADLKAVQPTLPDDPSDPAYSATMAHPVQQVTWYEAILFANLLSKQQGLTPCCYVDETFTTVVDETNYISDGVFFNYFADGYRLPTDAEREYAARAGTTGAFSMHEPNYSINTCVTCEPNPPLNVLDDIAWWCGNSDTGSGPMAHPVGTKLPNPWGLYDMHGNVLEWCWDWFGEYPSGSVTDPTGPITYISRVMRGGSWLSPALFVRSAARGSFTADRRLNDIGFRLVRTIN